MSEIDERLNYIRERVDARAFHNARADLPYLLELVTDLRHQLATHASEANATCQEWDVKCQELGAQLATITALVPEAKLVERAAAYATAHAFTNPGNISKSRTPGDALLLRDLAAAIRDWRGE